MKKGVISCMVRCVIPAALILALAFGCDDAGKEGTGPDGSVENRFPVVEVAPSEICGAGTSLDGCAFEFDYSGAEIGEAIKLTVTIRNTGERRLWVKDVVLEDYHAAAGAEEGGPAFALQLSGEFMDAVSASEKFYVAPLGEGTPEEPDELAARVVLTRPADDFERTARLAIYSDASNSPVVRIQLSTALGFPKIQLSPQWVDFGSVGAGDVKTENVYIFNTGAADLELTGFQLSGSKYYTLFTHGSEYPASQATAEGITFEQSVVVAPGEQTYLGVGFAPEGPDPATGALIVFSNDPDVHGGSEVKITGNEAVPCISVNPEQVSFGGKHPGEMAVVPLEIKACGAAPLTIYGLSFAEGSSPDFAVDLSTLDQEPTDESPLVIPLQGSVVVNITFIPDEENPLAADGTMLLDEGTLLIHNNSFDAEKAVEVSGAGSIPQCPTAIVKCMEGDEVIPQTVLHLVGDESHAVSGVVTKWQWEVEQPAGSQSTFVPSSSFPNPTFETNLAGVYTFYLTVYDGTNVPSCFPASYEVVVIPDEAIHIELLWHTPEDPDETDTGPEAGSDLDLHFKHPWAAGPDLDGDGSPDGWFDIPFDAFWFNAHPNWGSYDPGINDDPGLDRDDTDGAGPENINLDIPENVTYCVGVHYWNDHGYGASYATVRVYIYSQLVFEASDYLLTHLDMWEPLCLEWPSGKVAVVTDSVGSPKITPNYENPYFWNGP